MLTRAQFSFVVRADEKWVENATRALGVRLGYSIPEARWLGLVHQLASELRIALAAAAAMATRALAEPVNMRHAEIAETSGGVSITIDLARYHSIFAAAVATALHTGQRRASGRPPRPKSRDTAEILQAASARGVDLTLLRAGLERTPAERLRRLDENTAFIRAIRPAGQQTARTRALVPLVATASDLEPVGSCSGASPANGGSSSAKLGGRPT